MLRPPIHGRTFFNELFHGNAFSFLPVGFIGAPRRLLEKGLGLINGDEPSASCVQSIAVFLVFRPPCRETLIKASDLIMQAPVDANVPAT